MRLTYAPQRLVHVAVGDHIHAGAELGDDQQEHDGHGGRARVREVHRQEERDASMKPTTKGILKYRLTY